MLPVIYSMSVSLDGFIAGPSTLSRPATGAAVANVTMISPGVRECSTTAPPTRTGSSLVRASH
jgi:hypothetical protein